MSDTQHTPVDLDLQKDTGLRVKWSDGTASYYPIAYLRRLSPSAGIVAGWHAASWFRYPVRPRARVREFLRTTDTGVRHRCAARPSRTTPSVGGGPPRSTDPSKACAPVPGWRRRDGPRQRAHSRGHQRPRTTAHARKRHGFRFLELPVYLNNYQPTLVFLETFKNSFCSCQTWTPVLNCFSLRVTTRYCRVLPPTLLVLSLISP